mmetsp:Transcript_15065/g.37687  ORF Transcript_15065/g.37687 Transcript_15065/m.37687 type:complete len:235 (-) Transcript_15065:71-775(-)
MAPVQDPPQPPLLGVKCHNLRLDLHRPLDNLVEHHMLPRLDLIHLLLAHLKQALIPNGPRLDNLGNASPKLPLRPRGVPPRETVQEGHVHKHHGRLVEGSDEVLAHRGVDGSLPPYARIHHGKEGGRDLDKGDATHVGACDVASQVSNDAPAESNAARVAVELVLEHKVFDLLLDLPVLCRLSARNNLYKQRLACCSKLRDKLFAIDSIDILIRYQAVHERRHPPDKLVYEVIR